MTEEVKREREELVRSIELICSQMKGPLSNVERAWLHEDRKEMRVRLVEIDALLAASPDTGAVP